MNNKWYLTSAAEECKYFAELHGIHIHITPECGSHTARIWVSDDQKEFFENNLLHHTIDGEIRSFYFSKLGTPGIDEAKYGFYCVSYNRRRK